MALSVSLLMIFNSSAVVMAEDFKDENQDKQEEKTDIDALFKNTFDKITSITKLATDNGVKPYFFQFEGSLQYGESKPEDIVASVKGGLQIGINEGRQLNALLPEDLKNYKETFSSIMDNYQHPILKAVVDLIEENQGSPKQEGIIQGRILVNDLQDAFKAPYSMALDELQQKIFVRVEELTEDYEKNRDITSYEGALKEVEEIKKIPVQFSNEDTLKFVGSIEERLQKVYDSEMQAGGKEAAKTICSMEKLTMDPDNMEVTLPVAVPEGYTLYVAPQWIKDSVDKSSLITELENSSIKTVVKGDNKTDKIVMLEFYNKSKEQYFPVQQNYLIYMVNDKEETVEAISQNPMYIDLGMKVIVSNKATSEDQSYAKSTMMVMRGVTHTGYVMYEYKSENYNRNIVQSILLSKEDTEDQVTDKLYNSINSLAEKYLPYTEVEAGTRSITVKAYDSEKLSQSIK